MSILAQLKSAGFAFNKALGQNFIVDEAFLQSIVSALKISADDTIVEVGTGAGTLTRALAAKGSRIVTYEIDKRLEPFLNQQFKDISNIELVFADALKQEISLSNFTVVANIPYYITTPLLMKFLNNPSCKRICILVQDDVARRIVASPGGKDYGALSVACQVMAKCKILKHVPRNMFVPVPNVDSAFIVIDKTHSAKVNSAKLERLLKGMFASRRKTVLNGLSRTCNIDKTAAAAILAKAGITEHIRPEQIPPEKFTLLANLIDIQ